MYLDKLAWHAQDWELVILIYSLLQLPFRG